MRGGKDAHDPLSTSAGPAWGRELGNRFLAMGVTGCGLGLTALDALTLQEVRTLRRLPYDEPEFSARVVRLQVAQNTDVGSRRRPLVRQQIHWLLRSVPRECFDAVYHPLCGPGLFADALLGNCRRYDGIDIGPATIDCAKGARRWPSTVSFRVADARIWRPSPNAYRLALLTYETFNAFPPDELVSVLDNIGFGLHIQGLLFFETRPPGPIVDPPTRTARWCERGSLFAATSHLLLTEAMWISTGHAYVDRFLVVDASDRSVSVYHSIVWAYDDAAIQYLLHMVGLEAIWSGTPFSFDAHHPQRYRNRWMVVRRRHP